jgi:N-acetylneuraminate synthase
LSDSYNKFRENHHIFIIAEAGSNWKCGTFEEDLKRAKQLIKVAAKAGADAIKFQIFRPETIYAKNAGKSNYLSEQGINENINKIFENLSMPYEMIPLLAEQCKKENIIFMATSFSVQDAKQVDPFVPIHKVASFEINHVRLLEFLASTKKPIILSTGASTYDEIDFAVKLIKEKGTNGISLLQCTSKYPSPVEALNLAVIPQMKSKYRMTIGLSDHSIDPVFAPTLAIGLGAKIIEKHFTLDKNLAGPDHRFALSPTELSLMVKTIRNAEKALGSGKKKILKEELELRQFATRAIQATNDVKKGEILREGVNFDVLRPGNRIRGIEARFLETVNNKKAKNDIKAGDGIIDFE